MLKVGDKLITRTADQIDADGASSFGMRFEQEASVLDVNEYLVETEDGAFTVDPDDEGHSWKNFYNLVK